MKEAKRKLTLIISVWLKHENVSGFEAYERRAARLMEKHGGEIECAVRVRKQSDKSDEPFEIHVVSFPNEKKFADYLADSETRKLAELRDGIIARTEIVAGCDTNIYHE